MKKYIYYFIISMLLSAGAFAQNFTYTGQSSNDPSDWNDADNWDQFIVPSDVDPVVFDGSYNGPINITSASMCGGINLANYSGTITIDPGANLDIWGALTMSTGTFVVNGILNTGVVAATGGTINASSAEGFTVSADYVGGATAGTFNISGCTFTAPSSVELKITGTISARSAGSFNANGGTVTFSPRVNKNIGTGFTGSNGFFNLNFETTTNFITVVIPSSVTVNGNLSINTSGTRNFILNTGTIDLKGDLDVSSNLANNATVANASGGSCIIQLSGTTVQNITGNTTSNIGGNLPNVVIAQGSGGTVSLSNRINFGRSLTINSNGAITANTSTIAFQNTVNSATISGTTTTNVALYGLLVNKSGTSLGISSLSASWVTISNLLTVTAGTFNTGNKVAFVSTAANTSGQVGVVGGTISGTVRVERFIPGTTGRKWRFLASPVTTTNFISNNWQQQIHITGSGTGGTNCPSLSSHTNGFDATLGNTASMLTYNESTAAWATVASTNATNLTAGTGYRVFVRGARSQGCSLIDGTNPTPNDVTLSATGTLATGTQVINLTRGTGSGWNLVGNPFQAIINWNNITRNNLASNSYYIFNPNGGVGGVGSYELYVGGSGGGANINAFIAPGHSFWVQVASGGGSISIPESAKAVTQSTFTTLFKTEIEDLFKVKITDRYGYSDEAYASFKPTSSACYDNGVDVEKFQFTQGTGNIAFYSSCDATRLAYNTMLPASDSRTDTMFMHVRVPSGTSATYTLNISGLSTLASNIDVYLIDQYTNTFHNLRNSNSYQFSTVANNTATQGANRFMIVYGGGLSSLPVKLTSFTAVRSGSEVNVSWATASEVNSKNFVVERSADGISFNEIGTVQAKGKALTASKYSFTDNKPVANAISYYRLKMVDRDATFAYSNIRSVDVTAVVNPTSTIVTRLFPVPANDKLTITLNEDYVNATLSYSIYDLSGKMVGAAQTITNDGNFSDVNIELPALSTGFYFLEVSNPAGEIQRIKFIKE